MSDGIVGFKNDISKLFRDKDINAMKRRFDLSKYEDVSAHSDRILQRLEAGEMPCDGPWPKENVELFKQWIAGGKLP